MYFKKDYSVLWSAVQDVLRCWIALLACALKITLELAPKSLVVTTKTVRRHCLFPEGQQASLITHWLCVFLFSFGVKIWSTSQICVSSLCRGHANLCIVPVLVYVLLKWAQLCLFHLLLISLTRFICLSSGVPYPEVLSNIPFPCVCLIHFFSHVSK